MSNFQALSFRPEQLSYRKYTGTLIDTCTCTSPPKKFNCLVHTHKTCLKNERLEMKQGMGGTYIHVPLTVRFLLSFDACTITLQHTLCDLSYARII